jgi:Tfp pilus assembly protein PilF
MTRQHTLAAARLTAYALTLSALMLCSHAHAAPYLPKDGKTVVETLKKDLRQRQLQSMRKALAAQPDNVQVASELSQSYIAQARNTGDPRYLGYAQAALSPWWKQVDAPTPILVLRATLRQSSHEFPAALTDLNLVISKERHNAQAWLTRATIHQVTGNYALAKNSCMHLYSLAPEIVIATCMNNIASLNGEADKSYAALSELYKKTPQIQPSVNIWVLTLLAEMSLRRGDAKAAQSWFGQALAADTPDSYLLGTYADFLLDQDRNTEVLTLLKDKTRVDALLLRYTLALKNTNSALTAEHVTMLEQRFNAAMLREETVHQREQARFELHLKNHPSAALILAQKNWGIQKESADLRIYLEAALANNNRNAALPALNWLKANQMEDKAVQALVARLGGTA